MNFEIEDIEYLAKPDSRDILKVETCVNDDCSLQDHELLNIQKTDRFFSDSGELKEEKLNKFVNEKLNNKNKLKGYDRENNTYSERNGDAGLDKISSDKIAVNKDF